MNPPELLLKLLEANFEIYLEWNWQLMQLCCLFQQKIMIYLFIFMSQVWTMKLTESINICYFSVRVARTIKETFMGNDGFLQIFISWMDCSQRIKDLLLHKWSIFQGRTYSCYSGKPWTYLKQGWYCKVWQSIIHWYMDLLTLSYHLQYAKRLAT